MSGETHNIAIAKAQTKRLWEDLGTLLNRSAVLLLCVLSAATVGCSAKVEVESSDWASPSSDSQLSTGEKARTSVELSLLQPRSPEPVATPKPPEPPKPVAPAEKPLNISGNTVVFNYRGGDTYYRSDIHVRVHETPPPRVEQRITIHRDAEIKPRRPVDERCDRLAREHEERVRRWKAFPGGY